VFEVLNHLGEQLHFRLLYIHYFLHNYKDYLIIIMHLLIITHLIIKIVKSLSFTVDF
jgi:hypothetical protein